MNYSSIRLTHGQHKGKWLCQAPLPYQLWLVQTCKSNYDIATVNVRISTGPFKERRLGTLSFYELESVANNEEITLNELDAVRDYMSRIPPDKMRTEQQDLNLTAFALGLTGKS